MKLFKIKHRTSGKVLFSIKTESLMLCVEAAVKSGAYLGDADLRGAYLRSANLGGADLGGADLGDADLRGAYLRSANLGGADLGDANLGGANLGGANLGGADLGGAYLGDAYLGDAYLRGADLGDADLRGAYLGDAYLGDAYLRGADLGDADLRGAIFSYEQASPEETERLDAVRKIILAQPERLDMGIWHGEKWDPTHTPQEEQSCGTPHCLAGWLQALSEDESIRKMEARDAGEKLAPTASKFFFTSNEIVMDFLKNRRYA